MSDLISRKKINDYIKGEINPYGKPFEGTAYELGLKIMRYIDAMDSAYSVEKIVEKLEEIRVKKTCNKEKCDTKELCRICVVDDAIEIVKGGGVNVD